MCIISLFDGVEAAHLDLLYPLFSLTKLRRGRAFATVWADPGRRCPPSYILTTLRYSFHRPCSTAHLPTLLHVENPGCGSSLVLCSKRSSSGVLSILQSHPQSIFDKPPCFYLSLITWNMLLFCWRMCLQLVLSASNCFLSTSFLQTWLAISPCCYCDLLVNCTNHFFFLVVFCAVLPKCHTGNVFTFLWDCRKGDWFCYPPHPTPCLIFSNK